MMSSKGWKAVQAHIPLIKFRKGGVNRAVTGATSVPCTTQPVLSVSTKNSGATGPNVTPLPIIEDYQLPPRFHRRPIDPKEIEYINRGGPE
ncbi:28S ribosomal protein S36, mitochondrial isoform X2 [Belonocnema kinseyi]|uniref:28S ribosomal protein S36, mitochondrial isoform X2 n=1 Tax=Belonocnema kinseyi TaxID=2817044 RepID=UPI00143D99E1|nr:28S ribosomal protein S36, mitochondrial isoform X2 [Belonocnema kinseyi]